MSQDEPVLAPPGAGLPAPELMLARAGFALTRRLMRDSKVTALFSSEGHRIMGMARSTPLHLALQPTLIKRPFCIEDSSRNWSVYMVLEHLRIVNNGVSMVLPRLCSGGGKLREVRIEDVKPEPDATPEVIGLYEASVERYLQVLRRLPDLHSAARHPHPWFGPLDAHGWHCLAAVHHWVHRRQIERILATLGVEPL